MSEQIIPDDEYDRMVKRIERWGRIETAARKVSEAWGDVDHPYLMRGAVADLRAALSQRY